MAAINNDWLDALKEEFKKPYYKKLFETVNEEYRTRQIFPPADDIFNAFHLTPLHNVKAHKDIGWEEFTDAAIMALNSQDRPIVFILWGAPAQRKARMLNNPKHLILKAPHPSPLSAYRGFFGSKPFSQTNDYLRAHGIEPIDWQIE